MNCIKKLHDNYLENFILPNFFNNNKTDYNFVEDLNGTTHEKCVIVRKSYLDQLHKNNYDKVLENNLFENYPIDVSTNKRLLGGYISNLPYCRFLENNNYNNVILKLDGTSKYDELNLLSSILRKVFNFKDLVLVFEIDNYMSHDFLKISYMIHNYDIVDSDDSNWLELLQSAMTELTLILSIDHAIWHLIVAHIIYVVKRKLYFTEILKVFEMASSNVFIKALEVKTLLFGTPLVFGQILNDDPVFKKYLDDKITNFISDFDIDNVFENYFNLQEINPNLNWLYGMKENIIIIKNFVQNILEKKDIKREDRIIKDYLSKKYDNNKYLINIPDIKKLLEILFVVGCAFHSTTFEFTKIIMTDVFYNKKLNNIFYAITIQTIVGDISNVFGDTVLYKGKLYKDEVYKLEKDLEECRAKIDSNFENAIYKNNIYGNKENMQKKYSPNTFTTYV
jgi:hypothetical protein